MDTYVPLEGVKSLLNPFRRLRSLFQPFLFVYSNGSSECNFFQPITRLMAELLIAKRREAVPYASNVSQAEYFRLLQTILSHTTEQIRIYGYDRTFMEDPSTRDAIQKIVSKDVGVTAILPKGVATFLDDITEQEKINIVRSPDPIHNGYILFDGWGAAYFNTEEQTSYKPEETKGVIFRQLVNDKSKVRKAKSEFKDLEARLRENSL